MNDIQIKLLNDKIIEERQIMYKYYNEMDNAHIQNQTDKVSALAAMVYAVKSIIDDLYTQLEIVKNNSTTLTNI